MNKLEKLIQELCPDGVEYKKISDVTISLKKGTLKQNELSKNGLFPVVNSGREYYGYYDKSNNDGDAVTFASRGEYAGFVSYHNSPFWAGGLCYPYRSFDTELLITKYLYYILKNKETYIMDNIVCQGSIPALNKADIENFKIPVPPIEVQREIVSILDKMEALATALATECATREKQYSFYRNKLLDFSPDNVYLRKLIQESYSEKVEKVSLGDVCKIQRGKRLTKKDLIDDGKYNVFHGGLVPLGKYNKSNRSANTVMVINVGASAGTVGFSKEEFWSSDGCFTLSHEDNINQKFLYYLLKSKEQELISKVRKAGIPTLDNFVVENIKVYIPPLEIQNKIVEVLDNFDKICHDLKIGLPKEIELRNKQYEFYRNSLLNFYDLENNITHTHTDN